MKGAGARHSGRPPNADHPGFPWAFEIGKKAYVDRTTSLMGVGVCVGLRLAQM